MLRRDNPRATDGVGTGVIPHPDARTFERFVTGSSDRLVRTAYLLCGDRGHAEDIVQTALLRTARRWRTARERPEAYARAVVVNLAKDLAAKGEIMISKNRADEELVY